MSTRNLLLLDDSSTTTTEYYSSTEGGLDGNWSITATRLFEEDYEGFDSHDYQKEELNLYYAICEILVAVLAVLGNALVILVFRKERRLRRRTNYYIVSLAVADFLVGLLGIPFAILASVGLPTNLHACLFTVSLLVVLCTISIFCLVAVSVDRYWAILHPMGYSRNVRTKTALVIISICWFAGTIIGFLPLLGWHKGPAENGRCFFLGVMDYNYLVFLYFGTIITPALLLAIFYAHIYHVVLRQLRRQIVSINSTPYHHNNKTNKGGGSGGTMLRVLGAAQKREVKATQNLSIIVLFFMICWIPLYTINCVLAFCKDCKINSTFMLSCIILSHLNSAGNPLLYAYHLKDFRAALKSFICNLFGIKVRQPPAAANNVRAFAFNNHFHYRLHSVRDQPRTTNSSLSFAQQHHQQQDINNGFGMSSRRANTLPLGGNDRRKLSAITSQTSSRINNDFVWRISELSDEGLEKRSMSLDAGSENDEVFLPNGKQNFDGQLLNPRNLNISKSTPHLSNSSLPKESMQSIQCLNETKSTCEEVTDGPPKETCDTSSSYVSDAGDFIHSPAKSVKLSPFRAFHEAIMKSANIRSVTQRSTSLTDERCSMDIGKDNNSFH